MSTSLCLPPQYLGAHLIGLLCGRRKNCLGKRYFVWPSYAGLRQRSGTDEGMVQGEYGSGQGGGFFKFWEVFFFGI